MATYHGIKQATCLNCGRVTLEDSTLEIMNDLDSTCVSCGFNLVAWFVEGRVIITNEEKGIRQEVEL